MAPNESVSLVSVVIPARNEAAYIANCLQSVFRAESSINQLEVLVVDGMSTDGTREILQTWSQKHSNLIVLDNPNGIVPTAMNIGIRAARGQFIVRLDAHSEYPPDYFKLCIETINRTGADNVGGRVVPLLKNAGLQARVVQALTTHWFGVGNSGFRTEAQEGWADTVPFGCFHRSVFTRIGFFDERLVRNQDYELNSRLRRIGGRIWLNPAIRITYHNQSTIAGLYRQAFITGQWNPWMWYVAPYSFAWRHAVPLLFVGVLLVAAAFYFFGLNGAGLAFVASFLAYLFLAVVASIQQSARYGAPLSIILPLLFFAYHCAYGSGSLSGLFRLLLKRSPVQKTCSRWRKSLKADGLPR